MANTYIVELQRDHNEDAWVVNQFWPSGTMERKYFYDHVKEHRKYHDYFRECCLKAPENYRLIDIAIDGERQMLAEYREHTLIPFKVVDRSCEEDAN